MTIQIWSDDKLHRLGYQQKNYLHHVLDTVSLFKCLKEKRWLFKLNYEALHI